MKLAIQLYSVRDHIKNGEDFLKILEEVKKLGFEGVEFAGYFGLDAKTIKTKLDELGLIAVGTHIGISNYEPENLAPTLEFCKTLGMPFAGVGGAPHSTVEEASRTAAILGNANKLAANDGIMVYYHNHTDEFKDLGGVKAIDIIKDSVPLELDTYWSFYAGVDNYKYIIENAEKIILIHVKDGNDGTPSALGEGQNDLQAVFKAAREIGIEWLVLENDNPVPNGLADAARSMEYLKKNL
ncbi:MAG: sugar phosphate isomerase/epimerase [Clostridiales bacterium]|jgi:sugar phosphate isomerase/epimerase|nr:sugar phosphate isomerase/epimerase [Clostridiales bacterium]